ncbi:hypothetical protein [Candidatus Erwinia dacicola]|uniref:Putative transposase domain protein n=1 Tax=Candidatus Erwinia dacicola TaxID=252393 RepID=A0A1E7Z104_9GAMM|nr:hypothetical protein [Candidatus Erwinia dacicola]OFC62295.1 hypothetical protein BBW68_10145 [Candidatus Erwinia dacicola]RAP72674.1 putative transposase domain protein [Candidatus Erwinia dacicola]
MNGHGIGAIVDGVVGQGYRARFFNAGELLRKLQKARSLLRLNEVLLKLDRLIHHGYIFELKGESYRKNAYSALIDHR